MARSSAFADRQQLRLLRSDGSSASASPARSPIGPTVTRHDGDRRRRWSTSAARCIRRHGFRSRAPAATSAPSRSPTSSSRTRRSDIDNVFGPTSPRGTTRNVANQQPGGRRFRGHRHPLRAGQPALRARPRTPRAATCSRTSRAATSDSRRCTATNTWRRRSITATARARSRRQPSIADSHGNPGFPGFEPDAVAEPSAMSRRCSKPACRWSTSTSRTPTTTTALSRRPSTRTAPSAPARPAMSTSCRPTTRPSASSSPAWRHDGITKDNTLFVVTADENDHFVGGAQRRRPTATASTRRAPTADQGRGRRRSEPGCSPPSSATRRRSACTSTTRPTFYINGNPAQTDPADAHTRAAKRPSCRASTRSIGGDTNVTQALADHAEQRSAPYDHADPEPDAELHPVRQSRLLPVDLERATPPCTPATDSASCFVQIARLRLEPRRLPERDHPYLARHRRPRRPATGRRSTNSSPITPTFARPS